MKKNLLFFYLFTAVLFLIACNFGQSLPAASPTQPAPNPTVVVEPPTSPAPAGISIAANGTTFIIPQDVAGGAAVNLVPASFSSDVPYWDVYPAYVEFKLNSYPLSAFHDPRVIIYPAKEYASMNEGAAKFIAELRALIANPSQPLPENLPFLPLFNAAQMFHSNEQFLKFQNGVGIRYLTQYGQAPYPINNQAMFYTFQGLSDDGAYYVVAILPVNIAFLSLTGDPESPLPPDGVPFDWNNFENMEAHFNLVAQKLNAADPNSFFPPLPSLDTFVQSINAGIK